MISSFVAGSASSAASHIAVGTITGLSQGESFKDAFMGSFNGIWSSMLIGGAFSAASTSSVLLIDGINPITGDPLVQVTAEDLCLTDQVTRIKNGEKYSFTHDSKPYHNKDNYLPKNVKYTEYIVPPSSGKGAGIQRIIVGDNGKWYYSPDYHNSFIRFKP